MTTTCRHFSTGHTFDEVSGWCIHGCGQRDDGRLVKVHKGEILPGPTYTPQQLDEFRKKASTR